MSRAPEPVPSFTGMKVVAVYRDETGRLARYDVSREREPTEAEIAACEQRDREARAEARTARLRWLSRSAPTPRADANRRRLAAVR